VLHATVELVEPLGHEQLVHLRAGDLTLAARIDRDTAPTAERIVALTLDPARAHLFDEATGVTLDR
jgi:multiple sugar transport system ATP-binding protein